MTVILMYKAPGERASWESLSWLGCCLGPMHVARPPLDLSIEVNGDVIILSNGLAPRLRFSPLSALLLLLNLWVTKCRTSPLVDPPANFITFLQVLHFCSFVKSFHTAETDAMLARGWV